jgi:hypothetical protein
LQALQRFSYQFRAVHALLHQLVDCSAGPAQRRTCNTTPHLGNPEEKN